MADSRGHDESLESFCHECLVTFEDDDTRYFVPESNYEAEEFLCQSCYNENDFDYSMRGARALIPNWDESAPDAFVEEKAGIGSRISVATKEHRSLLREVYQEGQRREGLAFDEVTLYSQGFISDMPEVGFRSLPLSGLKARLFNQTLSASVSIVGGNLRATGSATGDFTATWWEIKSLPIDDDTDSLVNKIVNYVEGDFRRRGA